MKRKEDMVVVTSFNHGIYEYNGKFLLQSLKEYESDANILAYHENSIEEEGIPEEDFIEGFIYKDLFLDSEYGDVLSDERFDFTKDEFLSMGYMRNDASLNSHAKYFARKVFSIYDAMISCADSKMICWIDSDCYARFSFREGVYRQMRSNEFDIWHVNRDHVNKYSDTYFILFDISNEKVKEFISNWYQLFKSKEVFKLECWADHATFDYLRKKDNDLVFCDQKIVNISYQIIHRLGHKFNNSLRSESVRALRSEI
jgi:hypothetical protein